MSNKPTVEVPPDDWPLPDSFLIELGRITAIWASLESLLNLCIGKLAGFDVLHDSTSYILLIHSGFTQRLHMLSSLCEELHPHAPNLKDYRRVISALESAQTLRNKYAHNGIHFDPESNNYVLSEGSARRKLKLSSTPVRSEELLSAAKEIKKASLSLYHLVIKTAPHGRS